MIPNNYEGMLYVRTLVHAPLTPEIVHELQPQGSFVMRVLVRAIADLHRYLAQKVEQMHDADELVRRALVINTKPAANLRALLSDT